MNTYSIFSFISIKMKITKLIFLILLLVFSASSCKKKTTQKEDLQPKVLVKTATISKGNLPDNLEFSGHTIYINKNTIISPISGYITKVNINPGDAVRKDQVLFQIQSEESYALRNTGLSSSKYGSVNISAPVSGRISQQNIFKNSVFVDKGSPLCDIVPSHGLFVKADVPFEYASFAGIGKSCNVLLPDSTRLEATFTKILPQMNKQSQTIKVLARLKSTTFIPENMIVKILIDKSKKDSVQILPKSCVLTDALMTNFWVMKLSDKNTTIKVPVKTGNQTHTQVEILSPQFSTKDRIISEGAYGLEEGVIVKTENKAVK